MRAQSHTRRTLAAAVFVAAAMAALGSAVHAQSSARPITAADFFQDAPRGFGDRNNSWPQAMAWWHGYLYVGTARQTLCSSLFSVWEFAAGLLGQPFANTYLPYPPPNPDLSCAPDAMDLSMQAEIWRWDPVTNIWLRVFQSPLDLPNPGNGGFIPPNPDKKLPYEIAFRGLQPYTEPDGTEALYAFGVNSTIMWDRTKLPPPRILRTTDGLNFTPVPQTPGTFLGDLPFNPDHSSYRSPVSFGGKLFTISGPVFGQGSLIASADPSKGDNAWFLAAPSNLVFYETAVFNGWLYVGTLDSKGYSVLKTKAAGPPPYQFTTVIPQGAFVTNRPAGSVVSMHVYLGRLYVGTGSHTEVIRINPDDTWDLVVGPPRAVPLAGGGTEMKYPISNLAQGFGHNLNDHAWQMDDPYRYLYIGTYNASISAKDDPVNGPLLAHNMGAHLYRTHDGWYYSAITTNGFGNVNPPDPLGGKFDYGIRTMATTPYGAFFGAANDFYGLAIFNANTVGDNNPNPVDRLEIEPTVSGSALLSWQPATAGKLYHVWRAEVNPIFVRDDPNFEGWNGVSGNKIPDTYVGPYVEIGVTPQSVFVDSTVDPAKTYMYYVILEGTQGQMSDQSNLQTFPLLTPPITFKSVLAQIDAWTLRQRYSDPKKKLTNVRNMIVSAQTLAAQCQIASAIKTLNFQKVSTDALSPESIDLEILMSKLIRRLTLYQQFPQSMVQTEFCVGP